MPVFHGFPIQRIRCLYVVLGGAATAGLIVLTSAALLVPVSASYLFFDGLGRKDLAPFGGAAALASTYFNVVGVSIISMVVAVVRISQVSSRLDLLVAL